MNRWLPPHSRRREALVALLVALALAIVVHCAVPGRGTGVGLELFHTHRSGILVQFTLYPDRAPTIETANRIGESRITTLAPGDNVIRLEARNGVVLYERFFAATFYRMADPPQMIDRLQLVIVLPDVARAERVVVVSSAGEAFKEIGR
jgi:hypothetical protein